MLRLARCARNFRLDRASAVYVPSVGHSRDHGVGHIVGNQGRKIPESMQALASTRNTGASMYNCAVFGSQAKPRVRPPLDGD